MDLGIKRHLILSILTIFRSWQDQAEHTGRTGRPRLGRLSPDSRRICGCGRPIGKR